MPVFIASNHPNGFLDGIIFSSLLKVPTYIFVRGDVFKKRWTNFILRNLKLIPIFRVRDGNVRESVVANHQSYDQLYGMFKRNKQVLIFPESDSHTVKRLRSLKKGIARIILDMESRENGKMKVAVIPTGLNYSFYKKFGKEIFVTINDPIYLQSSRKAGMSDNEAMFAFTDNLHHHLKAGVIHVPQGSEEVAEIGFAILRATQPSTFKKIFKDGHFFNLNHRLAVLLQEDADGSFHEMLSAYQDHLKLYRLNHHCSKPHWWQVLISCIVIVPAFISWLPVKLLFGIGEQVANKKVRLSELYDSVLFGVAYVLSILMDLVLIFTLVMAFGWWLLPCYAVFKIFAIWFDPAREILERSFQMRKWIKLKTKDESLYTQLQAQKDAILSKVQSKN